MRSDDGTSGGAVASPSIYVALDDMPVVPSKADWKVQGLDWRMIPYRAKGFTYCMFTAYLTDGIGATGENLIKLGQLAKAVKAWSLPYIIVADWNMQPDQLAGADFLHLVNGTIVNPGDLDHTCISGRMLDYAVVSPGMAHAVTITHLKEAPWTGLATPSDATMRDS